MAMLAEPRRRKRYNLCPRGKALYEDENRFGTKMLEKMGWTKGNGLGAKQDGEKDFVRIRFKNDAEGLGFEARDDQWTTHEEGFNGLLKSLNGEDNEANGKESEPEEEARPMGFGFKAEDPEEPSKKKLKQNISGMSLEEKSKQSRARVHYKKFTRGKDLSQYSEKDLANIFGKKATDDIEAPAPVEVEQPKEEKELDPNFAGVQTVSTGLSVSDYFKQKMEAMKNRLKNGTESAKKDVPDESQPKVNGNELEENSAWNDQEPSKKKKKKKDKERAVEPTTFEEDIDQNNLKLKKKKKSKRPSEDESEQSQNLCDDEKPSENQETNPPKKKKKKKDKQEEQIKEPTKKGNSKKKEKTEKDLIETIEIIEEPVKTKKKKSKKSELNDSEIIIIDDDTPTADVCENLDETATKKKRKSHKSEPTNEKPENTAEITEEDSTKKKNKSKKSIKAEEIEPIEPIPQSVPESTDKTSKKKKKSFTSAPDPKLEIPALATAVDTAVKKINDTGRKHKDDTNSHCST
ncbi:PIN2/TERF1-interacting telomerase inhibitor 1 isoform X2 [Drosophila ficusphila]|uniref:PIN2/TERF1-interacting telomerase inhibitor 1 isoform X2 n=1 Tax=Drosophila ficusphila TaxID=30025 RepID=UPI001C88FB84|nr:PIN2/TERF1-interacting telomerase inhibitor 1 isoform X2 [Drosophila ficusphila]